MMATEVKRRRAPKSVLLRFSHRIRESQGERFEKLVADLSAAFARTLGPEIDREIAHWLRRLVVALKLDRAAVLQVDPLSHRVYISHQWARTGVPRIPYHQDFRQLVPAYTRKLLAGEPVIYSDPRELAPDLSGDVTAARDFILESHVGIPMRIGGSVIGAVGFAKKSRHRAWGADLIRRLHLVAEIVGNALERKRMALERLRLRDELANISHVAALGELAASIAHEVNQPIGAILSNAEAIQNLLGAEPLDLAEVRTAISEIIQDDTRAAETIRRLRALFRKDQLERVPVDLGKVVREIVEIVQRNAMVRKVSLVVDGVQTLPLLLADRVQLQQAILNLVLNAFDAVGRIEQGPRQVIVKIRRRPHFVVVQVSDSGPGIDPSVLPRIFDPFFTTKPSGLGMGLAISRSIIEAHGGKLTAASDSLRGAIFTFELPVPSRVRSEAHGAAAVQ